ncbi:hypothetical protein chiPu_0003591 [Chiloscyllium punctatum]|uniref:Uncharacterized protein n=1 Tax=Chiloscyllium punctatum TaxID=137246 RepID=A0A401S467_CHIPU|nr:hypothetical protein [Chiloscyllium punctatum]
MARAPSLHRDSHVTMATASPKQTAASGQVTRARQPCAAGAWSFVRVFSEVAISAVPTPWKELLLLLLLPLPQTFTVTFSLYPRVPIPIPATKRNQLHLGLTTVRFDRSGHMSKKFRRDELCATTGRA